MSHNDSIPDIRPNTTPTARVIPLLDLNHFTGNDRHSRLEFVNQLKNAFHEIGFAGLINHGIPLELIQSFYKYSDQFFKLPEAEKRKYEIPGLAGQRGYTSFGIEHAKHSQVADLKEFFQFGQTVTDNDPIQTEYPENIHVEELTQFKTTGITLFKSFEHTGKLLMQAIALGLKLEENFFDSNIHNGNSILRTIHYPPILQEPESALRSEQHEDINLITLLAGASAKGLQLLTKEEIWMNVLPGPEEIVINVGDMLQRLTNNYFVSTTHRVVNPPREEWHLSRLSIPFFLHPRKQMSLKCLDSCVPIGHKPMYEPVTAGIYLDERLKEIGLKK
jgi:isopenicillin N synthase-like dioxygenase